MNSTSLNTMLNCLPNPANGWADSNPLILIAAFQLFEKMKEEMKEGEKKVISQKNLSLVSSK